MDLYEYIEENCFEHLEMDYYECPGGHVWHISNIEEEFERWQKEQEEMV